MTKIIYPGWDARLKQYVLTRKDPLGFGDYCLKLETWDGRYILPLGRTGGDRLNQI